MQKSARFVSSLLLAAALVSCGGEPFAVYDLDGGAVCRTYGSTDGIRRIEFEVGDAVQVIRLGTPDIEPSANGGVVLVDLDFDGDLDLTVATRSYASGETRSVCYLRDGNALVEEKTLSALRDIAVDPEKKQLTAWSRTTVEDDHETLARTTYVWQDGVPVPIARRALIHYIAEGEEIWRVVDAEAEPGQPLTDTDERWIFPEKFTAELENELWKETP